MRTYSEDLHVRVVEYVKSGHTHREATEVFKVSPGAICKWMKLDREGGSLKFELVPRSPHRVNHKELLAYVNEHPDAYLREIAAHFSAGVLYIV